MLDGLSCRPHPEIRIASFEGMAGVSASPMQNEILAALRPDDFGRLLRNLEPFPLPLGGVIHGTGQRERHLYFPTEGIVSRVYETESGASAAFAFTGREGVVGVATFLGGECGPGQAVVISPGYAYRLDARLLDSEFEHDGPLPRLLLRYTQALIMQIGQLVMCNRRHTLEQQLCRLFLSCLDRLPSNELMMTQELISRLLGVRRESVTEVAGKLAQAGQITYRRGHIAVVDRALLEAHACECYGIVKREVGSLLLGEDSFGQGGVKRTGRPGWQKSVAASCSGNRSHAARSANLALPRPSGRRA
jgi:CRP-like cAMP-binding protein